MHFFPLSSSPHFPILKYVLMGHLSRWDANWFPLNVVELSIKFCVGRSAGVFSLHTLPGISSAPLGTSCYQSCDSAERSHSSDWNFFFLRDFFHLIDANSFCFLISKSRFKKLGSIMQHWCSVSFGYTADYYHWLTATLQREKKGKHPENHSVL